jgi:hypothetical protein
MLARHGDGGHAGGAIRFCPICDGYIFLRCSCESASGRCVCIISRARSPSSLPIEESFLPAALSPDPWFERGSVKLCAKLNVLASPPMKRALIIDRHALVVRVMEQSPFLLS